jgi:hypothetical protein
MKRVIAISISGILTLALFGCMLPISRQVSFLFSLNVLLLALPAYLLILSFKAYTTRDEPLFSFMPEYFSMNIQGPPRSIPYAAIKQISWNDGRYRSLTITYRASDTMERASFNTMLIDSCESEVAMMLKSRLSSASNPRVFGRSIECDLAPAID